MHIYYDDRFIAQDSVNRAENFEEELRNLILNTTAYPYKHRKSKYSESENIIDLIFKGYIISRLVILFIIKYRNNA